MRLVDNHRVGRLALGLSVAIAVLAATAIVLSLFAVDQAALPSTILACIAAGAAFGPIGALIVRRRENAVGWTLLGIGGGVALSMVTLEYAIVSVTHHDVLPAWRWVSWNGGWSLVFAAGSLAVLLLLFPTGTLPSRRWRPVVWVGVVGFVGTAIAASVNPVRFQFSESTLVTYQNPAGIEAVGGAISVLLAIFGVMAIVSGLLCIVSIVVRFHGGSSDDRERIKWLAYVAVAGLLFLFVGEIVSTAVGCEVKCGNTVFAVFFAAAMLGVPAAVGAAILRHGLYDIEVVIRRTVVVGAIAVCFVAIYALVVGGVGALVQSSSSTVLSFIAAALVAVLFQPMLARARRFADRVVYGHRASPYEVLASFSARMAGRENDVVLGEMARVVAEGTGAKAVDVWLKLDGSLHPSASWPEDGADSRMTLPAPGNDLPEIGADVAVPVRHDEELLGALTVSMPAAEPATDATRQLLSDLAGQAGLVLRNVRLIEELRASRKRLVTAQDEERRKLERNIHDGAQQQLVALMLRLRLTQGMVDKDPEAAKLALTELSDATHSALDDLRDLARGIYPPLLADQGLRVALEAQAKKSPVDVRLVADAIGRHPQEIEAAVYFCSLEGLQNVAKYAGASSVTLHLREGDGALSFSVTDDGGGFDTTRTRYGTGLQGMADRLSALGGTLEVKSKPGEGTTVTGRLPIS
jgi:signal transduction histidine kinase